MSLSLLSFESALPEIQLLLKSLPPKTGGVSTNPSLSKVILRSAVVLLNSHLEAYLRGINEEAALFVNGIGVTGSDLPLLLRLKHCSDSLEELSRVQWDKRETHVSAFMNSDGAFWFDQPVSLDPARVFRGFKSPQPKHIRKLFAAWGVQDIFSLITRKASTRGHYILSIQSLADRRNSIAHGDATIAPSESDVRKLRVTCLEFVQATDRAFSRHLAKMLDCPAPW